MLLAGGFVHGLISGDKILESPPQTYPNAASSPCFSFSIELLLSNLVVIVVLVIGGFLFAMPTILTLYTNGYVCGVLMGDGIASGRMFAVVMGVLPHGILEFTGMLVAGAVGLSLCHEMLRTIIHDQQPSTESGPIAVRRIVRLVLVSVLLILIAAAIECNITPMLLMGVPT
ncbi:MAG: stage II sporulation protein M [Candidatus Thorarchaeota archaeon]|nr:stage II sporulation protein M [Candidatus Thorarchaeota archaeon]